MEAYRGMNQNRTYVDKNMRNNYCKTHRIDTVRVDHVNLVQQQINSFNDANVDVSIAGGGGGSAVLSVTPIVATSGSASADIRIGTGSSSSDRRAFWAD